MTKYKILNENIETVKEGLDIQGLTDFHWGLLHRTCTDLEKLKHELWCLGYHVEEIELKDFVIDWVCKSCLEFGTAEVSAETREQALKELECHYCGDDENLIFQQDTEEHGIDGENCWYCGKTQYYYMANRPEKCSNCGKPPEQGEPDWEDRE